jgi:hypothetical protein
MPAEKVREDRVRRQIAERGLQLVTLDGRYQIVDPSGGVENWLQVNGTVMRKPSGSGQLSPARRARAT